MTRDRAVKVAAAAEARFLTLENEPHNVIPLSGTENVCYPVISILARLSDEPDPIPFKRVQRKYDSVKVPVKVVYIKRRIESVLGIRIFRNATIPRGTDMYIDLQSVVDAREIKTVFDIGANVGQSALEYAARFSNATIYSFEPVLGTYQTLTSATSHIGRIKCFRLGMGNETGEAVINVHPDTFASSLIHQTGGAAEKIAVTTPAGFAREHNLETIDFMKVDTEGFDLHVLQGAAPLLRDQRIRFVMAECEPLPVTAYFVSFSALVEFFKDYPYKLFGIYRQQPYWDGRKSILFFNALFICNDLGG